MANVLVKQGSNKPARDQVRESDYDTRKVASDEAITGAHLFFNDIQGKSKHLTNIRQSQMLESGVTFLIQGIKMTALTTTVESLPVLKDVLDNTYIDLIRADKSYLVTPLMNVIGHLGNSAQGVAQFGSHGMNGLKLKGHDSIVVKSLQSFGVEMNSLSAVKHVEAVNYVQYLEGLKRRPIQ